MDPIKGVLVIAGDHAQRAFWEERMRFFDPLQDTSEYDIIQQF